MLKSYSIRLFLIALLLSAGTVRLAAQTGTSFTLEGTLLDPTGAAMPDGVVTVKNLDLGITRSSKTDQQGHYIFAALPLTGAYEILAQAKGFAGQTKRGLKFSANAEAVVDFNLQPGAVQETIEVMAAAPIIETNKSEVSHSVGEQSLKNLPDNGRNFFDFVQLTPGVVVNGAGSGAITLNGQGIRELTILADGIPNQLREIRTLGGDLAGANGTFSLDVVEEVQVITNAFSAEFGRSMAGVVNSITKTGTNSFHGDAFLYGRPGSIDAGNPLTKANPDFVREQWGGTLGGPIKKDRLHFLFNYEQTHQTQLANGITSPLEPTGGKVLDVPFKEFKLLGKVDYQINPRNRVDFRYSVVRSDAENQGIGGLNTSQRAATAKDHTQNIEASATSILGPRTVNEARFAFTKDLYWDYQTIVGIDLPPNFVATGPAINRAGIGNLGPDPTIPQDLNEKGYTWQDKLSHTVGKHNLKVGGEVLFYDRFVTFYNNFTGTYTFAAGTPTTFNPNDSRTFPTNYTQAFGISGLNYKETLYGAFVQDDWSVARGLTLNLGLRYDYETLMHDTNNFAPRFGFAWSPKKDSSTVIRGSFGIFYATIESSMINRESNNGPNGIVTVSLVPGDPLFPTFPNRLLSLPANANIIKSDVFIPIVRGLNSKDFPQSVGDQFGGLRVNPYAEHANFGIQHALASDWMVGADFTHIHSLKLLNTEDLNLPPYFMVFPGHTRTQAQADAQRPYKVPSIVPGPLGIDFGGYRRLLLQQGGDRAFYNAGTLRLTKRFSKRFALDGFYTFSRATSDSDNFRENTALHVNPANYRMDYGLSDQDRRHNFSANGLWQLPYGIQLSGIMHAASGIRYSGVVGSDAMGIATTRGERPGALGRNTYGGAPTFTMDTALLKAFRLAERQRVDVRADFFNLTNHFNVTGINNVIGLDLSNPVSTFTRPTATAPGRQFQFSARYSF